MYKLPFKIILIKLLWLFLSYATGADICRSENEFIQCKGMHTRCINEGNKFKCDCREKLQYCEEIITTDATKSKFLWLLWFLPILLTLVILGVLVVWQIRKRTVTHEGNNNFELFSNNRENSYEDSQPVYGECSVPSEPTPFPSVEPTQVESSDGNKNDAFEKETS